MDIWTDSLLQPFLAITAHWIEATSEKTVNGCPQLKLCINLIGFQHLPGHHNGHCMYQAFLSNLDHLGIANNVIIYVQSGIYFWLICGKDWLTLNNVANNHTLFEALKEKLDMWNIPFNRVECHIQSAFSLSGIQ